MKGSAMNNKREILIIIMIVGLFMILPVLPLNPAWIAHAQDELEGEAYAVFDSEDGSLVFFRAPEGSYTNLQTDGTKTYYTGVESYIEATNPWWLDKKEWIRSFSVREGDIIKPKSCNKWFAGCTELTEFDPAGLDTSEAVAMNNMFLDCSKLAEVDLSGFDTSSVTQINGMFQGCISLKKCDLSSFDTSNVKYMSQMFRNSGIEELDISSFDTSKVTEINSFFGRDNKIKLIKLGPAFTILSKTELKAPLQRIKFMDDVTETSSPILYTLSDFVGDDAGWYRVGGRIVAEHDSGSGVLRIFNDNNDEHCINGETAGSKTYYTGILNTGSSNPPWYSNRSDIKRVSVETDVAPKSCYRWFYGCGALKECDLDKLDTSGTVNMNQMFRGCGSLGILRLGEKSLFSVDPPNSGWIRVRLPDGSEVSGPEISGLSEYDGSNPGTYRLKESFACACFDSSDGTLTIFRDENDEYKDGQTDGTKVYYTGICLASKPPWENVKDSIKRVNITAVISPRDISGWFKDCSQLTELDLRNMVIPMWQDGFLENCGALRCLKVKQTEGGNAINITSGLIGIWKNSQSGEEIKYSEEDYCYDEINDGEWKLVTAATLTVDVDASQAYGNDPAEHVFKIYHTNDGSHGGDMIHEEHFDGSKFSFSFEDAGFLYTGDNGGPQYYDYSFSFDENTDINWFLDGSSTMSSFHYNVTVRDNDKKAIRGKVNWEGDMPEDRPASVIIELYRDGIKAGEQTITAHDGWEYSFSVPNQSQDGTISKYEVKEKNVNGYNTVNTEYDAVRIRMGPLKKMINKLWFRRDGKWYEAEVNFYGGNITIPGDAVCFDYDPEIHENNMYIKAVSPVCLDDRTSQLMDRISAAPAGSPYEADSLFNDCSPETVIPTGINDTEILNYIEERSGTEWENIRFFSYPYPYVLTPEDSALPFGTFEMKNITNVGKRITTEIQGSKEWDQDDHPDEITLILEQNGKEYKRKTIGESDGWKYAFNELPIYDDNGNTYEYEVKEDPVQGYLLRKETRQSGTENKAVRVCFDVAERFPAQSLPFKRGSCITYDKKGKMYKLETEISESGSYEIVFPTLDFDLVFNGSNFRGLRESCDETPITVRSVEVIESPYTFDGSCFVSENDQKIKWTAYDPESDNVIYPDRNKMYIYNDGEKGVLELLRYGLNIIPYSISYDGTQLILINEFRDGSFCIKKSDSDGNMLKGASFELYYTKNSDITEEWIKEETAPERCGSTDESGILTFEGIPYGCYILEETMPPPGYKTASQKWKAVINADGSAEIFDEEGNLLNSSDDGFIITNEKTRTVIRKTDAGGRLLGGAKLSIIDENGNEIESWTSSSDATHIVEGLAEGCSYILKETAAPNGFQTADDIEFVIQKGKDTEIRMTDNSYPVPTGVYAGYGMMTVVSEALAVGLLMILKRRKGHMEI